MADLYTKERDLQYPATELRIVTIEGFTETSNHAKLFSSFKTIASKYILHAIVKDVMAMILCVKKGFPYEAANKVCSSIHRIFKSVPCAAKSCVSGIKSYLRNSQIPYLKANYILKNPLLSVVLVQHSNVSF